MNRAWLTLATLCFIGSLLQANETASVKLADGFDLPVGRDATKKYYKARGYRPNGHLGEDWNGAGGGDTDLGDPVTSAGNGIVVFAQDYKLGWGNVVIIRHAYFEEGQLKFVDSLYGHLNEIKTQLGALVERGQLIGTIGSNHGMYPAHLHFEMRKDLRVGMFRSSFPRDFSVYWDPTQFIAQRRVLDHGGGRLVAVPVNTFPEIAPPVLAETTLPADAPARTPGQPSSILRRTQQLPDKYQDLRSLGY
jgi:murein DD-endopeptidase MepM/ murein hydrolase activator NlpD